MAYYYVQQWYVLPNIAEVLHPNPNEPQAGLEWPVAVPSSFTPPQQFHQGQPVTYISAPHSHFSLPQERYNRIMAESGRGNLPDGQSRTTIHPENTEDGLSMASLSQALPDRGPVQGYGQAYATAESHQTQLRSSPHNTQQQSMNTPPQHQQNYSNQTQSYGYQIPTHRPPAGSLQPQYHNQPIYQTQQAVFYPQYTHSVPVYQGLQRVPDSMMNRAYPANVPQALSPTWSQFSSDPMSPQAASPRSIPSVPRGPPRKPKQSGHALWVGNLPPGALVNDLKDHFSRDATNDIESVFLISKSNCAFVNYKTEAACAAAMARFHDSRFSGVRLVCRLRRTSTNVAGSSTGGSTTLVGSSAESQAALEVGTSIREEGIKTQEINKQLPSAEKVNDKYFIVKSLTVEDLELSARNGIWATQAHNEETLNNAYESVENVYLIFSANKSGEYFGYARMISPINEASAATLDWKPAVLQPVTTDPDLPRSIPTPATETAPRGRIIDDSARGTIFWEAETDSGDDEIANEPENLPSDPDAKEDGLSPQQQQQQPYGHPFRIQWLSTARLPFYRTRGLRNAWNSNREVKIARDGTELETSVGRRLISMFGTVQGMLGDQRFPPALMQGGMTGGLQGAMSGGMPGSMPGQDGMNLSPRHYQQRY